MKTLYLVVLYILFFQTRIDAQWYSLNSGSTINFESVFFTDSFTGYIAGWGGIMKTTDAAYSWINQLTGTNSQLMSIYFSNTDTGYTVGSDGVILKTMDGGTNWIIKPSGTTFFLRSVAFPSLDTGYIVGNSGTILKTTDGGESWYNLPNPAGTTLESVSFSNTDIGYAVGGHIILKTTNGGNNWDIIRFDSEVFNNSVYFTDSNNGCVTSYRTNPVNYTFIRTTTDVGNTWQDQWGSTDRFPTYVFFVDGNTGYAGGYDIILKTTNGGDNWTTDWISGNGIRLRSVFFPETSVGYAVGWHGVILKTGVTPVELISFSAQAINGTVNLNWSTSTELNNRGFEIERSTNKKDWRLIGFREGNGTTTETHNYSFVDGLFGTSSAKLYYRLKQIDFNGSFEYSDIVEVNVAPTEFSLSQNYPNPFNPSTNIQYAISSRQFVTLKVYDVLGREVATLINEEKQPGVYEVEFDGSNLSSGIYFYTLEAGEFRNTKKLILIK